MLATSIAPSCSLMATSTEADLGSARAASIAFVSTSSKIFTMAGTISRSPRSIRFHSPSCAHTIRRAFSLEPT